MFHGLRILLLLKILITCKQISKHKESNVHNNDWTMRQSIANAQKIMKEVNWKM